MARRRYMKDYMRTIKKLSILDVASVRVPTRLQGDVFVSRVDALCTKAAIEIEYWAALASNALAVLEEHGIDLNEDCDKDG